MPTENKDFIVIYEAPVIEKPEFRLYYDEKGNVLSYTTDKLEGNYIVIDAATFAEGRPDVIVLDNKITKKSLTTISSKYVPSDNPEVICHKDDISIITNKKGKGWVIKFYEL